MPAGAHGYWAAIRELYGLLTPRRRRELAWVFALMIVGGLAEVVTIGAAVAFIALLAGDAGAHGLPWLDRLLAAAQPGRGGNGLAAVVLLFMAAAAASGAIRLYLLWISQRFALGVGHELSVEIQRRVLLQPYSYHVAHNSSEIIASLEQVQVLVSAVLLQLIQAVTAVLLSAFIMVVLLQLDFSTSAIAAVTIGLVYAALMLTVRRSLARQSVSLGTAYEERIRLVQESLGGIRDIILDHSYRVYLSAFEDIDRRFTSARVGIGFAAGAPRLIVETIGIIAIAAFALVLSARSGGLAAALPIIGAIALGAQRLLPLVQQLYVSWTNVTSNRALIDQVGGLLRLPLPADESAEPRTRLDFSRELALRGVSFSYPGRREAAVDDVSLTIRRGSWLILTGSTGSGKSTLADLVMGLLEPTAGEILVDGVPLTEEKQRRLWQRSIAHVPQSLFLADTSIGRNIAFGVPADEVDLLRVKEAAAKAEIADFIQQLPDGYDAQVGERGVRLSGGQRQRLGIARAIYKQAPVLVLDEATNALDDGTEGAVLETLGHLRDQGMTIIMIAHRLSDLGGCDMIARLENGRLVELRNSAAETGQASASRP